MRNNINLKEEFIVYLAERKAACEARLTVMHEHNGDYPYANEASVKQEAINLASGAYGFLSEIIGVDAIRAEYKEFCKEVISL